MKLKGANVAFLVSQEFEDIELLYPLIYLSGEGAKIVIGTTPGSGCASPRPISMDKLEGKIICGRFGLTVPILYLEEGYRYTHCPLEELNPNDFDAVLIPGGFSPDYLRINEKALEFVREMNRQGKIIGTICHGAWVLISTGITKNKTMTSYVACKDDVVNSGANYLDEPSVRDGNIITTRTPDDLPEWCAALLEAISEKINKK